ncbi:MULTISPECIES: hypothetical protein [Nostoc]|nr:MULTISPECIES: hypothetical protein [Nostoc]
MDIDPQLLKEVGDLVRSPPQKIQRVHNRVSGSLAEKGFVPPQFY